jgi:aspartate racemase
MHKTIGIVGGTTPESTAEYYRHITRGYVQQYGNHAYPPVLIYSVSFQHYMDWMEASRWDRVAGGLVTAARTLEAAGADLLLIASNTMHLVYDQVQAAVDVPVLNLLDVVAKAIRMQGMAAVGLLGTQTTMEHGFYRDALASYGVAVSVPDEEDRLFVDRVINNELSAGVLDTGSRARFVRIVETLARHQAQGVILGCTEIPLLVTPADTDVPLLDTTALHARAALAAAIRSGETGTSQERGCE